MYTMELLCHKNQRQLTILLLELVGDRRQHGIMCLYYIPHTHNTNRRQRFFSAHRLRAPAQLELVGRAVLTVRRCLHGEGDCWQMLYYF